MKALSTGEIAERAEVSVHTVRYYEDRGLLPEPPRSASGHRQYGTEDARRLRFTKRAQELGFTLEEIKELLSLRATPEAGAEIVERAESKIAELDAKIRDLQRIRRKLAELQEACRQRGAPGDCLVLHALEDPDAHAAKENRHPQSN